MLSDNASHRIFKISELSRAIAGRLTSVSQESTVNLACTCRYLEEPVLSALWETQPRLSTLLKVLPEVIWDCDHGVSGLDLSLEIPNAQTRFF